MPSTPVRIVTHTRYVPGRPSIDRRSRCRAADGNHLRSFTKLFRGGDILYASEPFVHRTELASAWVACAVRHVKALLPRERSPSLGMYVSIETRRLAVRALGGSRQQTEGQRSVLPESLASDSRLTTVRVQSSVTSSGLSATAGCSSFAGRLTLLMDLLRGERLSLTPAHNLSCGWGVPFAVRRVNTDVQDRSRNESAGGTGLSVQCFAPFRERPQWDPALASTFARDRAIRSAPSGDFPAGCEPAETSDSHT